jgi:phosphoribosylglycinamide formyltransferase 1
MAEPFRVAVLSSRRSPGLADLVARSHETGSYEIVCVLASGEDYEDKRVTKALGLPLVHHPIRSFCENRRQRFTDLGARRDYDARSIELLEPYAPDAVLLSGYLLIATDPLLASFPERIVNVHGSDLARTGSDGRPLFPGLRAVADAIDAGETQTRATAHIVTERLDDGPILARSGPYPVPSFVAELGARGNTHAVHAYAYAHQEWMLATAWGSLLAHSALILSAARAIAPALAEDCDLLLTELA